MTLLKKCGWIVFCTVIHTALFGQVVNNRIEDRLELPLNGKLIHSTTASSTVEWGCINKALTKKCLVYHNDQWFHFSPPKSGKYFLNISSQKCRELQGVQLIIIEGNPCEIKSYKILNCISKIFQDDAYVELDSLKADTPYLVNVDGFLGDFCEFDIHFSTTPKGLPHENVSMDTLGLEAKSADQSIQLKWHACQTVLEKISTFEVYRLKIGDVKSTRATVMSTKGNAMGLFVEDYFYNDTLTTQGTYQYKIVGIESDSENRLLMDQVKVYFSPKSLQKNQTIATIPFEFTSKGRVEIFVINRADNELVDYSVREYKQSETLSIDLNKFVEYGIQEFWIKLRHTRSKELKQFVFKINDQGIAERIPQ